MNNHREINEKLDAIAEAIGSMGASADLLNALHACRPGHPLNEAAFSPFLNLAFMLAGRQCKSALTLEHRNWLSKMVAQERTR